MKSICIAACLLVSTTAFSGINVIYGKDNRKDVYEVTNELHLSLAKSTAGMINLGKFVKTTQNNIFDLASLPTLEKAQNLCASESFSSQQVAPNCSGFLVAPDIIVTAGHCYKAMGTPEETCKNYAWVFDYNMESATDEPGKDIALSNIYLCKSVINAKLDSRNDYSIIRLDRAVTNRKPLKFRKSGKIDTKTKLVVIGHPSGLPTKISDNGKITYNSMPTTFSTTLDTFAGNSGSAVFDAATGQVEGILIQGKTDYHPGDYAVQNSCKVVNYCDDNGQNCEVREGPSPVSKGEVVYRISQIASEITAAQASAK